MMQTRSQEERQMFCDGACAFNDGEDRLVPVSVCRFDHPRRMARHWLDGWDYAKERKLELEATK
jgi:hypothetical protein